ncbi:GFA family protein [Marinobacter sp. ATCH36]|uniref:GFA family protein n=1 Tax=Marinobacter sp. ATCH36 TaxID=2945106 RepID=UPI0020229834|nr:GFA family protein [Marinobacter sp. ATCH36]MCL7945422.1 GFA family protein [Marinobacter sp. ATCH36]
MTNKQIHQCECFCGAVGFTVRGEPEAMGYCHCSSCRHWSAAPVNAFTLWLPNTVEVTRGADHIGSYNKTKASKRMWCGACGGHLFTEHPELGLIDVYAAMLPELAFEPTVHVHYQEAVLPLQDGLPKLKDVPEEMGGSGEYLS